MKPLQSSTRVILTVFVGLVSSNASCLTLLQDDSPIKDENTRLQLVDATRVMTQGAPNLAAVETIVKFFGEEHVDLVGSSAFYQSTNLERRNAFEVFQDCHSVPLLKECIADGSDLVARWAIRKLSNQLLNSKPGDDRLRKRMLERKAVVDGESRQKLRAPLARALKDRTGITRAHALDLYVYIVPRNESLDLLQTCMTSADELFAARAIQLLANRRDGPVEKILSVVWMDLKTSKSEELIAACLTYAWLGARDDREKLILHVDEFERLAKHQSARIRQAISLATWDLATPKTQQFLDMQIALADDTDEQVRHQAIRSLRHANTPEVHARLFGYFNSAQSSTVRSAALESLGIHGFQNESIIISAADDKDVNVRSTAAYYLRHLAELYDSSAAYSRLESLKRDADKRVREEATSHFSFARQLIERKKKEAKPDF